MRILVVEDENTVATAVARGLRAEGFEVDVADNGEDGLWLAQEGTYDAIVLDIMLPKRNGYLVCRDLRDAGDWTPILMLTAKDGELDEAEGLDTGADDYLTKPFSFVVLVARLRALLRRARPTDATAAGDTLAAGDLRLDPFANRCTRGDDDISLTAREVAVLGFLMRRAGQIVSKQEIIDNVWDPAFDGDPNIVEVYVRRLRKKIDEPFGARSITTVRGLGYRLEADDGS
ncbi:MAG: response regulator transcription factor [Actinomycetota bacterium]